MLNTQAVTKNLFLNKISLFFIAKDNIEEKSKANRKKNEILQFHGNEHFLHQFCPIKQNKKSI